ncbi:glycosyltransferase family 4 protein [Psychrobacillus sp. MER TA 171]|uniref:glycosyltransferase family 4 protein n=1 Tax=Psychrobacillus sp. MER TA 171 TaxID=2939577 RepID=UPI002041FA7E|nr:glycosyltransferase family 4 protein [Psychrobacillus sp. MER TA 171]MCM3356558.1 glycosyltransferase family 4 protein [Psychrobacillus sp. MER TA 171]
MIKKRVLILVNHDIVIYNFRKELVERLISEGAEVYISSPYGERIKELISMGCQYQEINLDRHGTNIINELKLIKLYKDLVKRVNPDVVLTYTIKPNIYGGIACKSQGVPYIANITGLGTAVEKKGILQKIIILLYRHSFKKVQTVFFQNKENNQFFEDNKIALGKHKLIPGSGVNLNDFCLLTYPPEENIEFLFISRIMKEKGIDQYLEAAQNIRSKYPNTKFHICGFCEEAYEEVLEELQKKDVIKYHGMLRNVKEILSKTHCTVHPSYYPEGISNVLLESASSGRPIITTNRSGCKEVVEEGVNGFLVEPKNGKDLTEKLITFIEMKYDEKRDMGLNGRQKVEREFNRNIVVEEYLKEIKNI